MAQLAVNIVVGLLAAVGWPFLYFLGFALAAQANWLVGDPIVTDDGVSFVLGLGFVTLAALVGLFAGLNVAVSRWTGVRAARWIPAGALTVAVFGTAAVQLVWYR